MFFIRKTFIKIKIIYIFQLDTTCIITNIFDFSMIFFYFYEIFCKKIIFVLEHKIKIFDYCHEFAFKIALIFDRDHETK